MRALVGGLQRPRARAHARRWSLRSLPYFHNCLVTTHQVDERVTRAPLVHGGVGPL